MKIGTYTFPCDNLPICERLSIIKSVGYDFVCVDASYDLKEMVNHCEKIDLPVENIHLNCRGTSKLWLSDDQGEEIVERYCRDIRLCREAGIRIGIAHVTWGKDILPPNEKGLSRYERIAACAEACGFVLAVENSVSKEHLFYVLDHIKSPYVRYCYDCGHEIGFEPEADYMGKYADRLAAVHLHDTRLGSDLHIAPMEGVGDWDAIAEKLASSPYSREKICGEPGGRIHSKKEGKSAAEIREMLSSLKIVDDESLVKIWDGGYSVYADLSFEEILIHQKKALEALSKKIRKNIR